MRYRAFSKVLSTYITGDRKKAIAVLPHLFALAMLCFSCSKEARKPVVILQVSLEDRVEEIEWMEVQGSRSATGGVVFIEAIGYNDERFYLNLRNISDTGLVSGITINNVSCSNGLGFHTKAIQSGFLKITQRTAHNLAGIFDIYLQDDSVNNLMKVKGSFRIQGSE
jgi:hypothetical protein